jgi:hypothetical protein
MPLWNGTRTNHKIANHLGRAHDVRMTDQPAEDQLYKLDRALLDKHGPSYIDTILLFAAGMRAEGRVEEAQEAMQQCDRMRAILLPDCDLIAAYRRSDGKPGDPAANLDGQGVGRRRLDT